MRYSWVVAVLMVSALAGSRQGHVAEAQLIRGARVASSRAIAAPDASALAAFWMEDYPISPGPSFRSIR